MNTPSNEEAARLLVAARRAQRPGPRLPESCRPRDLDDALAIQRRVGELLGAAIGGWKCSVPSPARTIALAPIYAAAITSVSPCRAIGDGKVARIEPEIAFVLGRDLPPRPKPYSEAEVLAAIAETRLVLELIGARYVDIATVSYPELLADSILNQGLFKGPVLARTIDRPLEAFAIAVDGPSGSIMMRDGKHPDGHPLPGLVWLANFLASGGYAGVKGLEAGQIVTTGSYAGVLELPLNTALRITYGELGTLSVQFSAAD